MTQPASNFRKTLQLSYSVILDVGEIRGNREREGRSLSSDHNKVSQPLRRKTRNLFFTVLESGSLHGGASRFMSPEASLCACRGPSSHCVLTWTFLRARAPCCSFLLLLKSPCDFI